MNPSLPVIEIHGDDVTVEASYLAARLGLSVDRLRAEMRRGITASSRHSPARSHANARRGDGERR
jgi:hypothetical protein